MSEPKRYPRAEALKVAQQVYDLLSPYCERCKVVGSLRRRIPTVKDIEFLFVPILKPKLMGLFGNTEEMTDCADLCLERLLGEGVLSKRPSVIGVTAWGPKNKLAIHNASGIPIDFFATTEKNWWVSLVVRTGGKETNLALTTSAQRKGFTLHAYGDGVENRKTGELMACSSEEEVFRLCGLPFQPPTHRR
jgi:DNA polymerase/3'-5' exonuclease PolX